MKDMFTYLRINLQAGELFMIDLAHAAHMSGESGELWLTHDRFSEDFELKQGTQLALPKGKVLIEGLGQFSVYLLFGAGQFNLPLSQIQSLASNLNLQNSISFRCQRHHDF
ncbi:DUF2917 domain-containing protein [Iodobacter arcticus]|uniref:DUF2917 domain-containing protein n=1 Tax=Iodobacter arcticus TaxID=590593 RepID=A0ABW2QZL1_9NEIS